MDLTTSTKLMSTDNHDQSNPHGCQDITEGKESLLHGRLSFKAQNYDFSSHGEDFPGLYLRGFPSMWRLNYFKIVQISSMTNLVFLCSHLTIYAKTGWDLLGEVKFMTKVWVLIRAEFWSDQFFRLSKPRSRKRSSLTVLILVLKQSSVHFQLNEFMVNSKYHVACLAPPWSFLDE